MSPLRSKKLREKRLKSTPLKTSGIKSSPMLIFMHTDLDIESNLDHYIEFIEWLSALGSGFDLCVYWAAYLSSFSRFLSLSILKNIFLKNELVYSSNFVCLPM